MPVRKCVAYRTHKLSLELRVDLRLDWNLWVQVTIALGEIRVCQVSS